MANLDDDTLARLGHLNHLEFSRESIRWSGRDGELVERDGLLLLAGATEFPVAYNAVARLDPAVPAADVLAIADGFFGAKGRGYTVMVNAHRGGDEDLAVAAEAAGYLRVTDAPEMVVRSPVEPREAPAGIELRWIADTGGVADFFAVGAEAYTSLGLPAHVPIEAMRAPERFLEPHLASVVAYRGDEPLAAAMTLVSHGIAGVYWVATLAAARGQGLAELVTRAVTNRGFELGAAVNTLQASPMGEAIYRRMGYEDLHRVYGYARFEPPTA